MRTLYNLKSLDAGFARGNLLLVTLDTNGTPIPEASRVATLNGGARARQDAARRAARRRCRDRRRSTPSGNARALVMPTPRPNKIEDNAAFTNPVSPEYFDTMGIRLIARPGVHRSGYRVDSQHVAVVNETMAKFWAGDRDPIGMTLAFRGNPKDLITIVGVVAGHAPDEPAGGAAAHRVFADPAGRAAALGPDPRGQDRAGTGGASSPRSAKPCAASIDRSCFATCGRSISRSTRRWSASECSRRCRRDSRCWRSCCARSASTA